MTGLTTDRWTLLHRMLFRFFFIFLGIFMAPWNWLSAVPGFSWLTEMYIEVYSSVVRSFNQWFFHIRKELVPYNGSGDTSFGWADLSFLAVVSLTGMAVWSILDRRRPNYVRLNYWLCLVARYYVASVALGYGIIKLFFLQMSYPNLSQLATPLGDFLPMRLSWMFLGYSKSYQFFSGFMEVLAAILLLYRRTATLGVMLALVVFSNVFVMNMSYDIPVKIFSGELTLVCVFLLANEWKRISSFFIYNRPADACTLYHFGWTSKKWRVTRIILKLAFFIIFLVMPLINAVKWYGGRNQDSSLFPLAKGVYVVEEFIVNGDTVPVPVYESGRCQEMIVDANGQGSMHTTDTLFRRRYNRAYFEYETDTSAKLIDLRSKGDSIPVARFSYTVLDSSSLLLTGNRGTDSLKVRIRKSNRHFQLTENQFHWLSESNR